MEIFEGEMSYSEDLKTVKGMDKNDPFTKFCFLKQSDQALKKIKECKVSN